MGEKCGVFTADFLVFKSNVCSASGRRQLYWEMEDQISWVQSSLGAAQTKPSPGSQASTEISPEQRWASMSLFPGERFFLLPPSSCPADSLFPPLNPRRPLGPSAHPYPQGQMPGESW